MFVARLIPGLIVAVLLGSASSAVAQTAGDLQQACQSALARLASDSGFKQPEFVSDPPSLRSSVAVESYPYFGKSVPLVPNYDGWYFTFLGGKPAIINDESSVRYYMSESMEAGTAYWILQGLQEEGIESEHAEVFELMERGLAFKSNPSVCESIDIAELQTIVVDILFKGAVFAGYDTVYRHDGGFLGFVRHKYNDEWLYVFKAPGGGYKEIRIVNYAPDQFQNLGFEVRKYERSSTSVTPEWLHFFFEIVNDISTIDLDKLRNAVGEYPLPDISFQTVEEYLQEAEPTQ